MNLDQLTRSEFLKITGRALGMAALPALASAQEQESDPILEQVFGNYDEVWREMEKRKMTKSDMLHNILSTKLTIASMYQSVDEAMAFFDQVRGYYISINLTPDIKHHYIASGPLVIAGLHTNASFEDVRKIDEESRRLLLQEKEKIVKLPNKVDIDTTYFDSLASDITYAALLTGDFTKVSQVLKNTQTGLIEDTVICHSCPYFYFFIGKAVIAEILTNIEGYAVDRTIELYNRIISVTYPEKESTEIGDKVTYKKFVSPDSTFFYDCLGNMIIADAYNSSDIDKTIGILIKAIDEIKNKLKVEKSALYFPPLCGEFTLAAAKNNGNCEDSARTIEKVFELLPTKKVTKDSSWFYPNAGDLTVARYT